MKSTWRTSLAVVIALLGLPAMRAYGEPLVPLLEMNLDPGKLFVPQICGLKTVKLQFFNNHLTDAITVTWISNYIAHPATCVSDYAPKENPVGVPIVVPAQTLHNETITLSFIDHCVGTTTINFQGTVVGSDPVDTHAVPLTVNCNEAIPTVSEWAAIGMTLLLLTAGTIVFFRKRGRETPAT